MSAAAPRSTPEEVPRRAPDPDGPRAARPQPGSRCAEPVPYPPFHRSPGLRPGPPAPNARGAATGQRP
ncbi:hypothetical protein ACFV17_37860, partial [Streptomyces sp. NPDC059656]